MGDCTRRPFPRAIDVDRVLRGEKPADLPVQGPTNMNSSSILANAFVENRSLTRKK